MSRRTFDVDIKLRFVVESGDDGKVSPAELERAVIDGLRDWNDGRYPFDVEMIHKGAVGVVEAAVGRAIYHRMSERYGTEMVPMGNGSATSRAVLEADKIIDGVTVWWTASRDELASVKRARNPEPPPRPLLPGERCTRAENHPAGEHHHGRWRQRYDGGRCTHVKPTKESP